MANLFYFVSYHFVTFQITEIPHGVQLVASFLEGHLQVFRSGNKSQLPFHFVTNRVTRDCMEAAAHLGFVQDDVPADSAHEDSPVLGPLTLAEYQESLVAHARRVTREARQARVLLEQQELDAGVVPEHHGNNPNRPPFPTPGDSPTPAPMWFGRRAFLHRAEAYGPLTLEEQLGHEAATEELRQGIIEDDAEKRAAASRMETGNYDSDDDQGYPFLQDNTL